MPPIQLDGASLTLDALAPLLDSPTGRHPRAEVPPSAWEAVRRSRATLEALDLENGTFYGINTGFGKLCDVRIGPGDVERLQVNLVRSHAVGVGPDMPPESVRIMLALKVQSLVRGHSAVQEPVVRLLLDFLNADLLPCVPTRGSVGASGDLAPLSHLCLPLFGEGYAHVGGVRMSGGEALRHCGLRPVTLRAKDGLALINGTQFMGSCAAIALVRAKRLARAADAVAGLSLEAMRGLSSPFDARIHDARPHPGARAVARNMRALLAGSSLAVAPGTAGRVQDPYSLRCIPQVHGASRDMLSHCIRTFELEANSTTDNPLVFDGGDVVSGGNFHGQPLALMLDAAAIAVAELASISERRTYLLMEGRSGLPRMLVADAGLNSGLMITQYTSAALVSENKVLCHPASVDSIPTSIGQEDHVSMGSIGGVKALQVLANAEAVLAIELIAAAQAVDLQPDRPGPAGQALHRFVRSLSPTVGEDRSVSEDIGLVAEAIRSGKLDIHLTEAGHGLE